MRRATRVAFMAAMRPIAVESSELRAVDSSIAATSVSLGRFLDTRRGEISFAMPNVQAGAVEFHFEFVEAVGGGRVGVKAQRVADVSVGDGLRDGALDVVGVVERDAAGEVGELLHGVEAFGHVAGGAPSLAIVG